MYVYLYFGGRTQRSNCESYLEQKQRSLVIKLRKNVWNLNKTRPKVAIVIGEGSNRIKEEFSAFTMQDQKWQTVISEEFIVQEHALAILWIPIFS